MKNSSKAIAALVSLALTFVPLPVVSAVTAHVSRSVIGPTGGIAGLPVGIASQDIGDGALKIAPASLNLGGSPLAVPRSPIGAAPSQTVPPSFAPANTTWPALPTALPPTAVLPSPKASAEPAPIPQIGSAQTRDALQDVGERTAAIRSILADPSGGEQGAAHASLIGASIFDRSPAKPEGPAVAIDPVATPAPAPGVVDRLIGSAGPIVVAHGKNEYRGVAGESTWGNIAHSVESAHGRPTVIEVDIRQGSEQFFIHHDPTFHLSTRDYHTPQHKIDAFRRDHPELARQDGRWDFLLFDDVGSYRDDELRNKIKIYDRPSGREYPLIGLSELLASIEHPGELRIPEHSYEARGPPQTSGRVPPRTIASGPIAFYLDFKEINHLARRLYNLPDWHWIMGSWSTERIEGFTRKKIQDLSTSLSQARAHDKAFIVVRHPRIAAMAREIDPGIRIMASPDNITSQTSADEWIGTMEPFLVYDPEFIEIKYLNHIRDPRIRAWAREHHLKILYDEIPQSDTSQFEGVYHDDLGRLFSDIVEQGADIMIQTNTPDAVQSLIDKRHQ